MADPTMEWTILLRVYTEVHEQETSCCSCIDSPQYSSEYQVVRKNVALPLEISTSRLRKMLLHVVKEGHNHIQSYCFFMINKHTKNYIRLSGTNVIYRDGCWYLLKTYSIIEILPVIHVILYQACA